MSARRELAVTSSASSFTSAGHERALGDRAPLLEDEHAERERVHEQALGRGLADVHRQGDAQQRRGPRPTRSGRGGGLPSCGRAPGPSTGATITNGVMVIRRNSSTLPRARAGRAREEDRARHRHEDAGVATGARRLGVHQPREGRGLGEAGVSAHFPPGRYPSPSCTSGPVRATAESGSSIGRWPGWTTASAHSAHGHPPLCRPVRAVPEPRAVVARLQRPRARPGRGRRAAAARAGEVPRHLQPEPRRVLPGAGVGPAGAARRRPAHHHPRRPRPRRPAPRHPRPGRRARRPGRRRCSPRRSSPALEDAGIRFADWDDLADDDRAHLEDDVRRARSSRCSRRSPSTPRTRSPTSRTCRSTSRSPCATRRAATSASRG